MILIRRDRTGGPSAARNEAIKRAKGTWLAILDGDDLIAPERTRSLMDLAEATSADLVADNFERFRIEGQSTGSTMIPTRKQPYAFLVDVATFIKANISLRKTSFSLGAIKPMFHADFVRDRKIRYKDDLPVGEDYLVCLVCLLSGARFVVSSQTGYKYRMRERSQSWRLSEDHVEKLLRAHGEAGLAAHSNEDASIKAADRLYMRDHERARAFIRIVDQVKRGEVHKALYATLSQPQVWGLVVRFGAEALLKRLRRTP